MRWTTQREPSGISPVSMVAAGIGVPILLILLGAAVSPIPAAGPDRDLGGGLDPALMPSSAAAQGTAATLFNLSTRARVREGTAIMIGGFVITGDTPKRVLLRARGPSLGAAGVPGAMVDPKLKLFSGASLIGENDNWKIGGQQAEIQTTGKAPKDDAEAALLATLAPGAYTVHVQAARGASGVAIFEVIGLDEEPDTRLFNVSTRATVETGSDVAIGGFVISGAAPKQVLIRARGPSMAGLPAEDVLADPALELFAGATQLAENDDWGASFDVAAIAASGRAPAHAAESAILATLEPGAYTAIVRGANAAIGIGIVEVIAVDDPSVLPPPGALQVTIEPPEVRAAGARWRVIGTETWMHSGATAADLPSGEKTVEFKAVDNWSSPGATTVAIESEQTAALSRAYEHHIDAALDAEGFEGQTLHHEIVVLHAFEDPPDWTFQLVAGPPGLQLVGENLLMYPAPWGSGGTQIEFTVRVTDPATGAYRDLPGTFSIMAADVLAQGPIGPDGGEISDPVTGVRLLVPAGAVETSVLFLIVRGTSADGAIVYTVHTDPAATEIHEPLQLDLSSVEDASVAAPSREAAPDSLPFQPMFTSDQWTQWEEGGAVFLQSNNGVARNRIPDGQTCHIELTLRGILNPITTSVTTCYFHPAWRLSSMCGTKAGFGSSPCRGRTPVLFVHGYQPFAYLTHVDEDVLKGGDEYWSHFPAVLHAADYAVFGFQWRTSQRFQDAAADLAKAVAQIRAATGRPVHIIAHSFGGLVARTYLQGLATDRPYAGDVATLVTIATPHSGIGDEQVYDGVRLPDGRSQGGWVMGECRQLSCYQAGYAHEETYRILSVLGYGHTRDMRAYFGVDPDQAGEIPARLASAANPMPVPMLALYGLTSRRSVELQGVGPAACRQYVSETDQGDGFISWEGQRVNPTLSCPDGQTRCRATPIGSTDHHDLFPAGLNERVLGFGVQEGQLIKPGDRQILSTVCPPLILAYDSGPRGYRHSDTLPVRPWGAKRQTDINDDDFAKHAVYQEVLSWLAPQSLPIRRLNDTGITSCGDAIQNDLRCPVNGYPGQDAQYGRDVIRNDPNDGHAGFSFTKLDANGNDVPAGATRWSCVRDNVTGLIWEVKTDDGSLRDKDWDYSWYNRDGRTNGGSAGTRDGGFCGAGIDCDTSAFVRAVNAAGLCGGRDWRLPSIEELLSIVNNDRLFPAIDTDYFPNTNDSVWSSSPYAGDSGSAWSVKIASGIAYYESKSSTDYVRLVRGGQ